MPNFEKRRRFRYAWQVFAYALYLLKFFLVLEHLNDIFFFLRDMAEANQPEKKKKKKSVHYSKVYALFVCGSMDTVFGMKIKNILSLVKKQKFIKCILVLSQRAESFVLVLF